MGYREKNIWTHEGPSIEKKERKKYGHMKVHEKKKKKREEIAMLSKEFVLRERDHTQNEFPFHAP